LVFPEKEWKGSPKMKYYSVGIFKKEWKGSPKMKYYSVGIFKKESNYKFQKNKNLSP
jgi:hypothetical protein